MSLSVCPRALVAEDSLLHQRLAIRLLQNHGFQVTVVDNGRDAVLAADNVAFPLILMDIEMPLLNGCAATRQIRQLELVRGRRAAIVAVSSVTDRARVVASGVDAFVPKPLSAAAVDNILSGLIADSACC